MNMNVDVIDNDTGEILKEGVLLASAHIYLAKRDGKVVRDDINVETLDDIDGGGQIEVRNLWVEIPEILEDIRKEEESMKKTREFWNNWSAQRNETIW